MPDGVGGDAWDEDQMSSYVDCGDYLLESHFQPPMSMASLMPGWFGDHAERMKNFGRVHSAGILFPADRRGRVKDQARIPARRQRRRSEEHTSEIQSLMRHSY